MAQGLYDRGYLINFGNGELVVYRNRINYVRRPWDKFVTIKDNQTLYDIAREHYNSSSAWFIIADCNPDVITDIFDLPVGETILIPDMRVIEASYGST